MNILDGFDKAFESKARLGIMAILNARDEVDFNEMKNLLQLSDGNLASHATTLEKLQYIEIQKSFKGKKPLTVYKSTKAGQEAFSRHLKSLETLLNP